MNISASDLDWSLLPSFLAVARNGSLSAAARELGISQPTLGRQIKALEAQLQMELFHRHPRGFELTKQGHALLGPAQTMQAAARDLSLLSAGQQQGIEGTVRVTASVALSNLRLPAIIAHIREVEPSIAIELVPSDKTSNLLYREADIAVRMYPPTQLALIRQHIGDLPLALFGSKTYLARRGRPKTLDDLTKHDFVGYDKQTDIIDGFRGFGVDVSKDFFGVRCDDNAVYWSLVRAGCGLGFAQQGIGDEDPLVERLNLPLALPVLPIWLTAHEAMRNTPRIKRVWSLLAEGLKPLTS